MNPFAEKARKARARADALNRPTAHEQGMAEAFPLGPGFGRGSVRSRAKRIDVSVNRARLAVEAEKKARWLEAQAAAFDRGEINAQGRRVTKESRARSDARYAAAAKREERIEAAKAIRDSRPRHEVSPETWADAAGYLGGSARKLVMSDQVEYIAEHQEEIE